MASYRTVTPEELITLPLGTRAQGLFQTFIGFVDEDGANLCIGHTCLVLPPSLYLKRIKTEERLEKLARYLEIHQIRSWARGHIGLGRPMETWTEEGVYADDSPCLYAEIFTPLCGLSHSLRTSAQIILPSIEETFFHVRPLPS